MSHPQTEDGWKNIEGFKDISLYFTQLSPLSLARHLQIIHRKPSCHADLLPQNYRLLLWLANLLA